MSKPTHDSDCALHNGPATWPGPCDCGADPSMTPEEYGSEFPAGGGDAGNFKAAAARFQRMYLNAARERDELRYELATQQEKLREVRKLAKDIHLCYAGLPFDVRNSGFQIFTIIDTMIGQTP